MNTTEPAKNRLFGLDILRATAVMSVVFGHSMWLFYANIPSRSIFDSIFIFISSMCGYLGVEVFFVLSGFLIGSIFINEFTKCKEKSSTIRLVGEFWVKRWFRTIPNYYLYIIIYYFIYYEMQWTHGIQEFSLKYFIFTHNFFQAGPGFLGVSWSLSVEEWFYLLLPISFSIILLITQKANIAIKFTFVLLLLVPLLLRINYIILHYDNNKVHSFFGLVTIYRLDSIAYGTFIAWIWKNEYYKEKIILLKGKLFILGLVSLTLFLLYVVFSVLKPNQNPFLGLITYPWASISISLIFPFMICYTNPKARLISDKIHFISKISYSLYLAHPLLIALMEDFKKSGGYNNFIENIISFIIVIFASFVLATITYKFCEQPFLRLRGVLVNKYFK
jgi:peptidoglycan/LPS O-acetylase OafA/YrhL